MNTLCLCPKETLLSDSCSKLCGMPGWKSRTALKGNNKKSDSTTTLLCFTFSSPCSVLPLQTVQGRQEEMCFLSQVFQNKIQQSFCLATCLFFSLLKWLSGSVGDRKSHSDPQLIEHLTPKGTDLLWSLAPSKSVWVCCGRAHVYAHWDYFCWLTRASSRKSCYGSTCWNVLFAPGNVFIDLGTMTPFIDVSVLRLLFATQHWQFDDLPNVSARLIAAFCDLSQMACD